MRLPVPSQLNLTPRASITDVRLRFEPAVPMAEVADTLELARLAAESLHGPERVELELRTDIDVEGHAVSIGTGTRAGRTVAIVFLGLVKREFGDQAVHVLRHSGRGVA
jgi:hypothetical protein